MKKLFHLMMAAIGLMISFQACSSDNDPIPSNNDDVEPTPLVLKRMTLIDSDGGNYIVNFLCEGNKLVRIGQGSEGYTDFFYEGELISREVRDDGAKTDYEYDADSRLIRSFYLNPGSYSSEELIEYNGNMVTVQETTENFHNGIITERLMNVWFNNGNITSLSSYSDEYNFHYDITYDDKPNIFSGILGLDKLLVAKINLSFLTLGANNALIYEGVNGTNYQRVYTYEYNAKGYPTHVTLNVTTPDGTEFLEEYILVYY